MKKINWGIIGCGNVVQTKSGPSFKRVPNSNIHAISRRNLKEAKESAEGLQANKYYDNYEDLVLDKEVDAIYIATPPGLHKEQAIFCARNKKPVYLEKPFARNEMECLEIINEFKKENVPLYIAHYRRAHPRFLKIKELIDKNVIGEIYTFECNLNRVFEDDEIHGWMFKTILSGGGKFFDIAPHMIDILIFLFGKVSEVKSYCRNINKIHSLEEIVVSILKMENDILGTLNFNLTTDVKSDKVFLRGKDGEIEFSIHGSTPILIKKNGIIKEQIPIEEPLYIQEPMIKCVVEDLISSNPNVCSGEDALETYRVIDIILDEFYKGREREFWRD